MKFRFLFLISPVLFLWACGDGSNETRTPSGFKYEMHTNVGGEKPAVGDYVYFHAQTRNGDNVVNASRITGNGQIPFLQIIPDSMLTKPVSPVQELLRIMSIGDSATIYLPQDTLTEEEKPAGFKGVDHRLYDLVMIDIKTEEEFRAEKSKLKQAEIQRGKLDAQRFPEVKAQLISNLNDFKAGKNKSDLVVTDSGLKVLFHEKTAGNLPFKGVNVAVHYAGVLMDGTLFDNSFEKGRPIVFPLGTGRVIPGWDEGIALLPVGSKATLFIPYNLAYGETGYAPIIPAKADLAFYVELVELK